MQELNVESSRYADWVETVKCTYSSIEDKKFLRKWIQHTIKEIKTCDDVFGYTFCAIVTVTITKLIENGITFMSIIEYAIAFFIGLAFLLFAVGVLRKKRNFYEELLDVILELEKD